VDRYAGEVRGRTQRALLPDGRHVGPRRARHRLSGDRAGRRMEVDPDAAAIRREDHCGKVWDGECLRWQRQRKRLGGIQTFWNNNLWKPLRLGSPNN
jgi:hypothetical protein